MHSYNQTQIDLSALLHNLDQVCRLIAPDTRIMGVVKSDAYGHGQVPVARALEGAGVACLGVSHVQEAVHLREERIRCPIVALSGIGSSEEAAAAVEWEITPVLFDVEAAELLAREAKLRGRCIPVQVKVDTGMGRLGLPREGLRGFIRRISASGALDIVGLISHLSSADEGEGCFTERQVDAFRASVSEVRALGVELPLNNLANSAGIMAYPASHFEMVRPGIMLYGGLPAMGFACPVSLKPVMRFSGRVLQIRDLPHGTPVSYGRTYFTRGPRRIAVLSAGYGDGLPRILGNRGWVLIRGHRLPLIGRICMNLCMCDITGLSALSPGEEAVFLGRQGEDCITGEQLADWAGTISYEIFCTIGFAHIKEYLS